MKHYTKLEDLDARITFSIAEVGALTGTSRSTINRWIREGRLPQGGANAHFREPCAAAARSRACRAARFRQCWNPRITGVFPSAPPSSRTVETWGKRFWGYNVAFVPHCSGLVVVDADDAEAAERCTRLFGPTPGCVRTRRGRHFLYRASSTELPGSIDLRAIGLSADLKHGPGDIAMAPPSVHPLGGCYRWLDCEPEVLRELPEFDVRSLRRALEGHARAKREPGQAGMRDGSRKQYINDQLCAAVSFCDTLEELLDCAVSINAGMPDRGLEALRVEVVEKIGGTGVARCPGGAH